MILPMASVMVASWFTGSSWGLDAVIEMGEDEDLGISVPVFIVNIWQIVLVRSIIIWYLVNGQISSTALSDQVK